MITNYGIKQPRGFLTQGEHIQQVQPKKCQTLQIYLTIIFELVLGDLKEQNTHNMFTIIRKIFLQSLLKTLIDKLEFTITRKNVCWAIRIRKVYARNNILHQIILNIHFFSGQRHVTSASYVCFSLEVIFTLITVFGGGNANSWHEFHKS